MGESVGGGGGERSVRPREQCARDPRVALSYALAAIGFGLAATTGVLYGVSRRRQEGSLKKLKSELALAEKTSEAFARALACEKRLREELAAAEKRYGEMVSSVREGDEEKRQRYTRAERERREMSRIAEEKTDELIQRHNRIVELQEQVERLMRERSEAKDAAFEREKDQRRVYEAELRNEHQRRRELEEKLAVLDEIHDLQRQLARLADKMQELVQKEAEEPEPKR